MQYEVLVCPLCGSQVVQDGGYDSDLVWSCDHRHLEGLGDPDPITLKVTGDPEPLLEASRASLWHKAERVGLQRRQSRLAAQKHREGLTRDQRWKQRAQANRFSRTFKSVFADSIADQIRASNRQFFGD